MKKIIALVLSIVLVCCFSVTAFAADSPVAGSKETVIIRKAVATGEDGADMKADVEYAVKDGAVITVKADETKYGKFDSWSIYKDTAAEGTAAPAKSGIMTLSVLNLATATAPAAVEGTDYEIISGSLTSKELTVKINSDVIICGNYDGVITDPNVDGNKDDSSSSPTTGDMTAFYAIAVILSLAVFAFSVKKVYSK